MLQVGGEFAADPIGDIDLAVFERRQPCRLVGDGPDHHAFDARRLAPVLVEGFEHQLDAGIERHEFVGPSADRRLFEPVLADLLDVFLRHDPTRAGCAAVERQEVGPRLLEMKAHPQRIEDFDVRHARLHHVVRGAAVAHEREFDVLGGHRLAIVEREALAQHEFVAEPILRGGPRLGEARCQSLPRHRLHHRVMQRVQHHERRDDPRGLRRVEPGRRERDMRAPNQLCPQPGGERCDWRSGGKTESGKRQHLATVYAAPVCFGIGSGRVKS